MLNDEDVIRLFRKRKKKKAEEALRRYYLRLGKLFIAFSNFFDKKDFSCSYIPVAIPDKKLIVFEKYITPVNVSRVEGKIRAKEEDIEVRVRYIKKYTKSWRRHRYVLRPDNAVCSLEFFLNPHLIIFLTYMVSSEEKRHTIRLIIERFFRERIVGRIRMIEDKIRLKDFFLSNIFVVLVGRMEKIIHDISNMLILSFLKE